MENNFDKAWDELTLKLFLADRLAFTPKIVSEPVESVALNKNFFKNVYTAEANKQLKDIENEFNLMDVPDELIAQAFNKER